MNVQCNEITYIDFIFLLIRLNRFFLREMKQKQGCFFQQKNPVHSGYKNGDANFTPLIFECGLYKRRITRICKREIRVEEIFKKTEAWKNNDKFKSVLDSVYTFK